MTLSVQAIDTYYGPVKALRGVTLEVGEGEMVALLGPNGAGKTTTLRAISGMINPRKGEILIDGVDVSSLPAHRVVRLGVAHMPQGRELFPELTVEENLRLGHWSRRKEKRRRAERTEAVFDLFPRLGERAKQAAGTMSGGEQQMLTVARALMSEPKVLLVDEASLGLAPKIVRQLYDTVARVNERFGTAVLLVDQFVHLALAFTSRAYVLEKGEVVVEGRSQELLDSPELLAAYLGEVASPDDAPAQSNGHRDEAAAGDALRNGRTPPEQLVRTSTVQACLDAVDAGRHPARDVLEAERANAGRVTLIRALESRIAAPKTPPPDTTTPAAGEPGAGEDTTELPSVTAGERPSAAPAPGHKEDR